MKIEYDERADKFTIEITRMGVRRIIAGLYFMASIIETDWNIIGPVKMLRNNLHEALKEAEE